MYEFKIDIKTILILLLGLVIVLMILFKPPHSVDFYEKQIELLNQKNETLNKMNDSLNDMNNILKIEIDSLNKNIESVNVILNENNEEIIRLKKKRNEIFNSVNSMGVNDITRNFSDYLKRGN
jgi:peptidoglycan hydrolase CwlO-like protein